MMWAPLEPSPRRRISSLRATRLTVVCASTASISAGCNTWNSVLRLSAARRAATSTETVGNAMLALPAPAPRDTRARAPPGQPLSQNRAAARRAGH